MAALFVGTASAAIAMVPQESPKCWLVKPGKEGDPPELRCENDIVVTGKTLRDQVIISIQPLAILNEQDVAALGAFTIEEALQRIQTATSSPRGGTAIVLLSGVRISGMEEVRTLPPEAVERIDVLPEEAARSFGYDGTQRVTNVVLKRRFKAMTMDAAAGLSTDGGRFMTIGNGNLANVAGKNRMTLSAHYEHAEALLESERGIALPAQAQAQAQDQQRYRTLLPDIDKISVQGTMARPVLGLSTSFTSSFDLTRTDSLYGIPGATLNVPATSAFAPGHVATTVQRTAGPDRVQRGDSEAGKAALGIVTTGGAGGFLFTAQANYEHSWSRTQVDRGLDGALLQAQVDAGGDPQQPLTRALAPSHAPDISNVETSFGQFLLNANGPIARAPAGAVTIETQLGAKMRRVSSHSLSNLVPAAASFGREEAIGSVIVTVPLTRGKGGPLPFLGTLSVNYALFLEHLSDMGTLRSGGPGVEWQPAPRLRLFYSHLTKPLAPTLEQLGEGVRTVPAVPVFDYRSGRTVLIAQVEGGNPALRKERLSAPGLGISWQPFRKERLSIYSVFYRDTRKDAIRPFPIPSAVAEQAFPGRFVRDATGALVGVDNRVTNFARATSETISTTISWFKTVTPPAPALPTVAAANHAAAPPPRRPAATSVIFGLSHVWHLREAVELAPGLRAFDLLGGDAILRSGSVGRHEVKLQNTLAHGAWSLNSQLSWRSATRLYLGANTANQFDFRQYGTADLGFGYDLSKLAAKPNKSFLAKSRVRLDITNIANARPAVRDRNGKTPLIYQPAYLDPRGRTVTLRFRKQM